MYLRSVTCGIVCACIPELRSSLDTLYKSVTDGLPDCNLDRYEVCVYYSHEVFPFCTLASSWPDNEADVVIWVVVLCDIGCTVSLMCPHCTHPELFP